MKCILVAASVLSVLLPAATLAGEEEALQHPSLAAFLASGYGTIHEKAPPQTREFGQLVGLWQVESEMKGPGGQWVGTAPGYWAWKYAIDGFGVQDLWFQSADNLPSYMANLKRDYLLTASRVYVVAEKSWQVFWMANGAGQVMGADFGAFEATMTDGEMVMMSEPGPYGTQRVVFHGIEPDAFRWKSEYSMDGGKTWSEIMRLSAVRIVDQRGTERRP